MSTKIKQPFPNGYNHKLFRKAQVEALANIILDYKTATGEFASIRGLEDSLSLYLAKDNYSFNLANWRKELNRTDY